MFSPSIYDCFILSANYRLIYSNLICFMYVYTHADRRLELS